jgi:hypothetical protein
MPTDYLILRPGGSDEGDQVWKLPVAQERWPSICWTART